jgi:hypothetical protein
MRWNNIHPSHYHAQPSRRRWLAEQQYARACSDAALWEAMVRWALSLGRPEAAQHYARLYRAAGAQLSAAWNELQEAQQ